MGDAAYPRPYEGQHQGEFRDRAAGVMDAGGNRQGPFRANDGDEMPSPTPREASVEATVAHQRLLPQVDHEELRAEADEFFGSDDWLCDHPVQ